MQALIFFDCNEDQATGYLFGGLKMGLLEFYGTEVDFHSLNFTRGAQHSMHHASCSFDNLTIQI